MSELNMLLVVFCDSVSLLQTNIFNELTSDVSRDSPFATVVSTFSATVCKTVRPTYAIGPLSVCPVCLSVCIHSCLSVTLVYCGQTVGRIKMKLGMQVALGPGHIVLYGEPGPPPAKGHSSPNFGPYLLWPKFAKWLDGLRCHLVWR